jgi:hypothetical protein
MIYSRIESVNVLTTSSIEHVGFSVLKHGRRLRVMLAIAVLLGVGSLPTDAGASTHHHHHASAHNRHGCNAAATWDCRSLAVKHEFWEMSGHPHGWKGHIVDHRRALLCGGLDAVSNMQWETVAEAKAKDRWEAIGCKDGRRVGSPAVGHAE